MVYKITKRILFEKTADKLVWGLWGGPNGNKHQVKVSASVELPPGGVFQKYEAHFEEMLASKNVTRKINAKGWALFIGEGFMQPDEDLVLTLTWNKGVVTPDASSEMSGTFNWAMGAAFCAVLACCLLLWFFFGRDPKPNTVIPLFYPPVFKGRLLSPGAVDYLCHSAELTSKGFSAMLLNLAAQKPLTIFGKGTRHEPYVLRKTGGAGEDVVLKNGQSPRELWKALLRARGGFDNAERAVLKWLFQAKDLYPLDKKQESSHFQESQSDVQPDVASGSLSDEMGDEPLQEADYKESPLVMMNSTHSWKVAMARSAAYMALSEELRPLWKLRADIVSCLHFLAYLFMTVILGVFYFVYGTGASWAATLTIMCMTGALSFFWYKINVRIHLVWIVWKEMGGLNLVLYAVYITMLLLSLFYDGIMDKTFMSFPGYEFMYSWQALRVLLISSLAIYIFYITHSYRAVLVSPLVALVLGCAISIPLGIIYYASAMPGVGGIFLLLALLLPTLFAPIMKQPTKQCADILAAIQGFAMYLGATEAQMYTVLDVPDKTPDEFRRGMPYAVALGLEKAWGAQFAGLAGKLRMQGSMAATMAEYNHRLSGE